MPINYGTLFGNIYPLVQIKNEIDKDSVMFCIYNKNQIFTLIYTIVKSHPFACKYAETVVDPVNCRNKLLYYKFTGELMYLKNNKTTKFKAKYRFAQPHTIV